MTEQVRIAVVEVGARTRSNKGHKLDKSKGSA